MGLLDWSSGLQFLACGSGSSFFFFFSDCCCWLVGLHRTKPRRWPVCFTRGRTQGLGSSGLMQMKEEKQKGSGTFFTCRSAKRGGSAPSVGVLQRKEKSVEMDDDEKGRCRQPKRYALPLLFFLLLFSVPLSLSLFILLLPPFLSFCVVLLCYLSFIFFFSFFSSSSGCW